MGWIVLSRLCEFYPAYWLLGRGNRIRNPDGTPIELQEENAEPEAPKEGETPAGEQEEKAKQ